MKTISVKLDETLANWLEGEARRLGRTKSDIAREALQRQREGKAGLSVHERMRDVCGIIKGAPSDMSRNVRKYLKGFGQ